MSKALKIGVSACLLGHNVRFNGGHQLNHFIRDILGQHMEFVPVCPEVECGMPIPREALRLVGLEEFANNWPSELSGGMAQRVALARAFIQEPDLLLLDEPFGALDALTRERMGSELLRIWQGQRVPVVMVTHSISEALLLSDRVLLFTPRPGEISADIAVPFPRPRKEELRYSAEFQRMERSLRGSLQHIS